MSIPSIPSRFLTPVLKFDLSIGDSDLMVNKALEAEGYRVFDSRIESKLVAKVAKLNNDGSTLGPGSYNLINAKGISKSPKGTVWSNSTSQRRDHFTKSHTLPNNGPGAH